MIDRWSEPQRKKRTLTGSISDHSDDLQSRREVGGTDCTILISPLEATDIYSRLVASGSIATASQESSQQLNDGLPLGAQQNN